MTEHKESRHFGGNDNDKLETRCRFTVCYIEVTMTQVGVFRARRTQHEKRCGWNLW